MTTRDLLEFWPIGLILVVSIFCDWSLSRRRIQEWARREKLTLVSSRRMLFAFRFFFTGGWPIFRVTVSDVSGRIRSGVVRFGAFRMGVYRDMVQVSWD